MNTHLIEKLDVNIIEINDQNIVYFISKHVSKTRS